MSTAIAAVLVLFIGAIGFYVGYRYANRDKASGGSSGGGSGSGGSSRPTQKK